MRMVTRLAGIVALCGLATSCSEAVDRLVDRLPDGGSEEVQAAIDGLQQGSLETALLLALTGTMEIEGSEAELAASAAAAVRDILTPSDCVLGAEVVSDTVNYALENCNGPYGLRNVTGGVNLAFVMPAGPLGTSVALTSASLDLNGAPIAINVSGGMDDNDGVREYELITAGGGVSRDGEALTRSGSFTARIEEDCMVMQGGWLSTINTDLYPTVFTGFTRCDGPCPSSGTMVLGEAQPDVDGTGDPSNEIGIEGEALTMTFVGSRTIAWADSTGRTGATTMVCEF